MDNKSEEMIIKRTIINDIDFLLENNKYINYKGKYSKKKIEKSIKRLREFKKKLETGEIDLSRI